MVYLSYAQRRGCSERMKKWFIQLQDLRKILKFCRSVKTFGLTKSMKIKAHCARAAELTKSSMSSTARNATLKLTLFVSLGHGLIAWAPYHGYQPTTQSHTHVHPHHHKKVKTPIKDGAPTDTHISFFEILRPIYEPFSHYGNRESYKVNGKIYEVMTSASGYHAKGMASWYGTKFHKQKTSSGEPYNMYAMTAAHRTLPLPTYVRVKNIRNGKEAVVRVNDRGPFHSKRLIDLSYAAASKLGLMPRGTAMVEITALHERGKKAPVAHYYVQAGAFETKAMADRLQKQLKKWSKNPIRIEHYNKKYIVKVGPFANKKGSDQYKNKLHAHGVRQAFTVLL